jgi:hypothetical protein
VFSSEYKGKTSVALGRFSTASTPSGGGKIGVVGRTEVRRCKTGLGERSNQVGRMTG